MIRRRRARPRTIATVALLAAAAVCVFIAVQSYTADRADTLTFDIAEHAAPPDEAGPDGGRVVSRGYLYPLGTLSGADGVNPDGSPAFPDKVVGRWTAYGAEVGGAPGESLATTQVFDLGAQPGETTIVSSGYDSRQQPSVRRAIVGGTGRYSGATGEQVQVLIAAPHDGLGAALRVTLRLRDR